MLRDLFRWRDLRLMCRWLVCCIDCIRRTLHGLSFVSLWLCVDCNCINTVTDHEIGKNRTMNMALQAPHISLRIATDCTLQIIPAAVGLRLVVVQAFIVVCVSTWESAYRITSVGVSANRTVLAIWEVNARHL